MDEIVNKIKQRAEKATKNMLKSVRKKMSKVVIMALLMLLKIMLPIILLAMFLGAFTYFINGWDSDSGDDSLSSTSATITTTSGSASISVDTESVVNDALKNNDYTDEQISSMTNLEKAKALGIEEGNLSNVASVLWASNSVFSQYLASEEQLEKFINVEYITQYPYIDDAEEGSLNGIIKFYRQIDDSGDLQRITYVDENTFNTYVNNYTSASDDNLESAKKELLSHFTMSSGQTIKVATLIETTEEISSTDSEFSIEEAEDMKSNIFGESSANTLSETTEGYKASSYAVNVEEISYLTMVSKYTMPSEYLWTISVVADDKGAFAETLADYCYNSEIEISIYDNENTNITTDTYSYKIETETNLNAKVGVSLNGTISEEGKAWDPTYEYSDTITVTYKKTTVTDTKTVALTKANTWISDSTLSYNKKESTDEGEKKDIDVEKSQAAKVKEQNFYTYDISNNTSEGDASLLNISEVQNFLNDVKANNQTSTDSNNTNEAETVNVAVTSVNRLITYKKIDITQTSQTTVKSISYEKGTVEKNGDNADKFIEALNSNTKAKSNILEVASWLFEYLEQNDETADMVTLTRYLLNEATGTTDYGDVTFDFSTYDPTGFTSFTSVYSGNVQDKVWYALKDLGYSDIAIAGAMGNIDLESGGFDASAVENGSGTGIGLLQWSDGKDGKPGRRTQLENYAKSKDVSWTDVDTQIEFLVAEISGSGPAVGYASQRTKGHIIEEGIDSTYTEWSNSTSIEDATLYFMRYFESPTSKSSYNERLSRANR
jgi:hypothetical protein